MSSLYSYVCARVCEADLTETLAATTACGLPHDLTRHVLERAPAPYVELRLSVDQADPQGYLRSITPGFVTMLLAGASDVLQARLGGLKAINTSDFHPDLDRALLAYCLLDREVLEGTPDDASEPWEGVTLSVWRWIPAGVGRWWSARRETPRATRCETDIARRCGRASWAMCRAWLCTEIACR